MKRILLGVFMLASLYILFMTGESIYSGGTIPVRLVSQDGLRTIELFVEVADEPHEFTRGLQDRPSLGEGAGMLFVFPEDGPLSFWMKDTLIPLDVLYFTQAGDFIRSYRMDPCTGDPCASYPSLVSARMALEVNAGLVEREAVGDGWRLVIE